MHTYIETIYCLQRHVYVSQLNNFGTVLIPSVKQISRQGFRDLYLGGRKNIDLLVL